MPPRRVAAAKLTNGNTKATSSDVFERCVVIISGTFKNLTQTELGTLLANNGAKVVKGIGARTPTPTHFVTTSAELTSPKTQKTKDTVALKEEGKIISFVGIEWVEDSIKAGKKLDESLYETKAVVEDKGIDLDAEEEEQEEKPQMKTRGQGKGKKRARSPSFDNPEEEEEDDDKKLPSPTPKMVKKITKNNVAVDEFFSNKASYHVHVDSVTNVPWDANLNQTDAQKNNNKFYKIQVLKADNGNQFTCFTRWGRVGESGSYKNLGGGSEQGAIAQFRKKFKDKARVEWESRADTVPKPGCYTFIEMSYDQDEEEDRPAKKQDTKERKDITSKLDQRVQDLTKLIFNTDAMKHVMKELNYDANQLPLGKLSKNAISKGYEVLRRISDILSQPLGDRDNNWIREISTLTDTYYTRIPHAFGRSIGPRINTMHSVKCEMELLDNLSEMKITETLMTEIEPEDEHPLDSQFKTLNLDHMAALDAGSEEFVKLEKLLANTTGSTHNHGLMLHNAYKVSRKGEQARFEKAGMHEPSKGKRRLLWHGSRSTNFVGILSQGLRIAPPEAPVSGYMFGKGVYLASFASKSAGYCYPSISGGKGLLLLCEAQLGPEPFHVRLDAEYEAAESSKKAGFLSTWGVGRTQPSKWEDASTLSQELAGIEMPSLTAPPKENDKNSSLLYDEFIVYNIDQIRIRYLLVCNFQGHF